MKILVTNDDSWHSPGLWALAESLAAVAEVVVVAPDREQSGIGPAVSLHHPIRATEIAPRQDGILTYSVEGTPADCVILGLERLAGPGVDMVFSGINQGANVGEDILNSGTLGGALQGFSRGLPAVAVSVAALRDVHYENAALVSRLLAERFAAGELPHPVLLNVNFPNVPKGELRELRVTRMGSRAYLDVVHEGEDAKRAWYWIRRTGRGPEAPPGTDVHALRQGYATITPLQTDFTRNSQLDLLQSISSELTDVLAGKALGAKSATDGPSSS